MFCSECGQSTEVPGVRCPRCGAVLPRSRGGTVVIGQDEPPPPEPTAKRAPAADGFAATAYAPGSHPSARAAQPAAPQASALQAAALPTISDAQPHPALQAVAAGQAQASVPLADPDTRSGLVFRTLFGTFSLMIGTPLIPLSVLIALGTVLSYRPDVSIFLWAIGLFVVGLLEVIAGARVLRGSSPLCWYLAGLAVQLVTALVVLLTVNSERLGSNAFMEAGMLVGVPILLPVVRLVPLLLSATGRYLGTRKLQEGTDMRAVPFVLWGPATTIFGSPVFLIGSLLSGILSIKVWVDPFEDSYVLSAAITMGALLGIMLPLFVLPIASVGLLLRARWSVAVGGAASPLVALAAFAPVGFAAYKLLDHFGLDGDRLANLVLLSFLFTGVFVPGVSWLVGAIRHGFKLPAYARVETQPGQKKPGLMRVLVPGP